MVKSFISHFHKCNVSRVVLVENMPFLPHQYISICLKSLLNSLGYLPNKNVCVCVCGGGVGIQTLQCSCGQICLFFRLSFISIFSWSAAAMYQLYNSISPLQLLKSLGSFTQTTFLPIPITTVKRCALGSHHFQVESLPVEKCSS